MTEKDIINKKIQQMLSENLFDTEKKCIHTCQTLKYWLQAYFVLSTQYNAIVEQNKSLQAELNQKEQECEELSGKYKKLLSESLNKQCRILDLQQKLSLKEFVLKVNGKKYTRFSGIDKARLFLSNENKVRENKILKLENELSALQWKFYDNCKEVCSAIEKCERHKQALEPFKDEYFKGLDTNTIAELAKKSIRLTRENRKLEEALDEIERYIRDELIDEFGNQVYRFNREKVLGIINKAREGAEC